MQIWSPAIVLYCTQCLDYHNFNESEPKTCFRVTKFDKNCNYFTRHRCRSPNKVKKQRQGDHVTALGGGETVSGGLGGIWRSYWLPSFVRIHGIFTHFRHFHYRLVRLHLHLHFQSSYTKFRLHVKTVVKISIFHLTMVQYYYNSILSSN